jgi:hypothetical protein
MSDLALLSRLTLLVHIAHDITRISKISGLQAGLPNWLVLRNWTSLFCQIGNSNKESVSKGMCVWTYK